MSAKSNDMRKSVSLLLFASLALLSSVPGCGGINSRIKEHERQFSSFAPQAQAQIQAGRIDKGFTEDMVYMAKGEPSEKNQLKKDGKELVVWKYPRRTAPPVAAGANNLSTPYGYPSFGPAPQQSAPLFYDRSYDTVEFDRGRVVRWDVGMQDEQ